MNVYKIEWGTFETYKKKEIKKERKKKTRKHLPTPVNQVSDYGSDQTWS